MEQLDEESIEQIIRDPQTRVAAAEALAQIRAARELTIPNAEGLDAIAEMMGRERGEFWVDSLKHAGQLETFVAALRSRGLAVTRTNLPFLSRPTAPGCEPISR